jgi:hypothetical protein
MLDSVVGSRDAVANERSAESFNIETVYPGHIHVLKQLLASRDSLLSSCLLLSRGLRAKIQMVCWPFSQFAECAASVRRGQLVSEIQETQGNHTTETDMTWRSLEVFYIKKKKCRFLNILLALATATSYTL